MNTLTKGVSKDTLFAEYVKVVNGVLVLDNDWMMVAARTVKEGVREWEREE